MSTTNKLVISSLSRTLFLLVTIAVAFYMMPFLIRNLGDKWYGIWTILGSIAGYYHLFDLGIGTAVTRYVSKDIATEDYDDANNIISTSFVIYLMIAVLIVVVTLVATYLLVYFFDDQGILNIIRVTLLIIGLNLALEFPFKAFSGIIGAYIRYDLLTLSHFTTLVIGTALIIYYIGKGHGIVSLALIGLGTSVLSNILFYSIAKYLLPTMQVRFKHYRREKVRDIFGYSLWSFLIQLSDQFRFKIDSIVIAFILNASYVTHYFIGARLAELFLVLIYKATNILVPVFTKYHALNDYDELRKRLLFLTKINAIFAIFGGGLIILVGRPFINIWVGEKYSDAYPIIVCLVVAMVIEAIQNPSSNVLYAISRHKYLAYVSMAEGVVNVVLSLILIQYFGIIGVALGTSIPLIFTRLFIVPIYVSKAIDLPVHRFYTNIMGTLALTLVYLTVYYLFAQEILINAQYRSIALFLALSIPLYIVSIFFMLFDKEERQIFLRILPRRA